jgi:palmitoyltransferase
MTMTFQQKDSFITYQLLVSPTIPISNIRGIKGLETTVLVLLALAPHPSLLIMLVNYHLKTLQSPLRFGVHLLVTYTLTFCIFSSVIICVARDPGPVAVEERSQDDDEGMDFTEALMAANNRDDDLSAPGKFCRKCWVPKPERAHHCSICGRCVLKMGLPIRFF